MASNKIQIDSYIWEIVLSKEKELQISMVEQIEEYLDPLWKKKKKEEVERYNIYHDQDNLLSKEAPAVTIVRALLTQSAELIKSTNTQFFYFTPSTSRKAMFYTVIVEQFQSELGKDWNYQIIDETWFYFTKHNSNK